MTTAFDELFTGVNAGQGRASINLVIDETTLTHGHHNRRRLYTTNGFQLPLHTIRRYLCDATITPITLTTGGLPLNVGRTRRTATDAQRAALAAIYPTCAWCDVPFDHCQIHHISFWENLGPTDLDNLIPLCTRHHHQIHEGKWDIRLDPHRNLHIKRPNGQTWAIKPPPTREPVNKHAHTRKPRPKPVNH